MPEFTPDEQVNARASEEEIISRQLPLGVKNPLVPSSPLGQNFLSPKFILPLGSQSLMANNRIDYSAEENIFQDSLSTESQVNSRNSEAIQRSLSNNLKPQVSLPENSQEAQDIASVSRQSTPIEAETTISLPSGESQVNLSNSEVIQTSRDNSFIPQDLSVGNTQETQNSTSTSRQSIQGNTEDTASLKPNVVQPQLATASENITSAIESQQIPLTEEPEALHQQQTQDFPSKLANPTPIVSSLQLRINDKPSKAFQSPQPTVQAQSNFDQSSQIPLTDNISENNQALSDHSSASIPTSNEAIAQLDSQAEHSDVVSTNPTLIQAFSEDATSQESSLKQTPSAFETIDFAASQAPAREILPSPIETTATQPNPNVASPNPTIAPGLDTSISTSEIASPSPETPTSTTNESSATTSLSLQTKPSEIGSPSSEVSTPTTNELTNIKPSASRQTLEPIQTKSSDFDAQTVSETKTPEEPLTDILETPLPLEIAVDIQIDKELPQAASTTEKLEEVAQPENISAASFAPNNSTNLLQRKATELSNDSVTQLAFETNTSESEIIEPQLNSTISTPEVASPSSELPTPSTNETSTITPSLQTKPSEIGSPSPELPTPTTNESTTKTTSASLQAKPNPTIAPELDATISTSEINSLSSETPTPTTNESTGTTPSLQRLESIQTKSSDFVAQTVSETKPPEEPLTTSAVSSLSTELPNPSTHETTGTISFIQTKSNSTIEPGLDTTISTPFVSPPSPELSTPSTNELIPRTLPSTPELGELPQAASTTEKLGEVAQPENIAASFATTNSRNLLQPKATESIAQLPFETTSSEPEIAVDIQSKSLGLNQPSFEVTQSQDFSVAPSADSIPLNKEATQSVAQAAETIVQPLLSTPHSGDNQTLFPENKEAPLASEQTEPSLEKSISISEPTLSDSVAAMPLESLPSVTTPINPITIQRLSEPQQLITSTANETASDANLSNTPEPITTEDNATSSKRSNQLQSNDLAASETTGEVKENAKVTLEPAPIALPNSTVSTPENLIQTQLSPAATTPQEAAAIVPPIALDLPSTSVPGEAKSPHSSEENTSLSVVEPPLEVETSRLSTESTDDPKIQLKRSLISQETAEVEAPSPQISPTIANNLLQGKTTDNESFNQNHDIPQLPTVLENLIESRHSLPLSQPLYQPSLITTTPRLERSEPANGIQKKPENSLTRSQENLEQPAIIQNQQQPSFNNSEIAFNKATEQTVKLPPVSLKPEMTIQKVTATNLRTTSRPDPENQTTSQPTENIPDSLSSIIESVPDSWASIAELLGEVNPDSPYSNVNPEQTFFNESRNGQPSNLLESLAESNYSNLTSAFSQKDASQRQAPEEAQPQEDISSAENPSAQHKDSGNVDSHNLERLAREIYNLVRQRLEIERERYGNYYSDRLPW